MIKNLTKRDVRLIGISVAAVIAIFSVARGAYEVNQIWNENRDLRSSLETKESQEQIPSIETVSTTTSEIASSTSESKEKVEDSQLRTIPEKEIVYVTKQVISEPLVAEAETPKPQVVEAEVEITPDSVVAEEAKISVVSVRQTQYPDGYGGTYGSYEIELSVKASAGEILIPKTTTDTIGSGDIGFSYRVTGDDFSGVQDSKISCALMTGSYCKFKNDGKTRTIVTTVFLTPYEDGTGNYAVLFDNLNYYENGVQKSIDINRKTATINIMY